MCIICGNLYQNHNDSISTNNILISDCKDTDSCRDIDVKNKHETSLFYALRVNPSFINMTTLSIFNCAKISVIPSFLTQLKILKCYNCPLISFLPPTLIHLEKLYCNDSELITIPLSYINLKILYCNNCPITEIPNTFTNLEQLNCSGCKYIYNLPNNLLQLDTLDCYNTNILEIPSSYIKLEHLDCSECSYIIYIPDTLINLETLICSYTNIVTIPYFKKLYILDCSYCRLLLKINNKDSLNLIIKCIESPWVECKNNDKFVTNINKVRIIQLWIKRNVKFLIFKKWIKNKDGLEWLYNPCNIGGRIVKQSMYKILSPITSPVFSYKKFDKLMLSCLPT